MAAPELMSRDMDEAPWETLLRSARVEERRGHPARAERAYRAALRANPGFDSLEREFSRFLESLGRFPEAARRLRRAMALGWPRAEGEEALSRLRSTSPVPAMIRRKKFAAAAAALEAGVPSAAADALWPEVFSALLCAGRYRTAFRLGDVMLEKSARTPRANAFLWPWWHAVSSRGSVEKMRFCARELARVDAARAGGGFPGWFAYCRGVLLLGLGRDREALAEHERIILLRAPRYSLMHHPFVMHRLLAGDLEWTAATCRALLEDAPDYWWFQCRLAEAIMAGGDVPAGLREFSRAAASASGNDARRAVMTWHGAALLWAGRYRLALRKLEESAAIGAAIWVHCWRGAAYLKLGEHEKALADLDLAIKTDPQDLEAHLWRGEALRILGRHSEALADLDRAISLDPKYAWAYVNRALARGALGDAKGMADDVGMIPADLAAAFRGPRETRARLEAGLSRAKGLRRPERYLDSIWMVRARG
jgi:tetratricopeptide (TPR) repeat protein